MSDVKREHLAYIASRITMNRDFSILFIGGLHSKFYFRSVDIKRQIEQQDEKYSVHTKAYCIGGKNG